MKKDARWRNGRWASFFFVRVYFIQAEMPEANPK